MLLLLVFPLTGDGFTKETIRVEYEWRPPRCDICKIFGHVHEHCPKKVVSPPIVATSNVVTPTVDKTNDGFQTVGKGKKKDKSKSTNDGNIATSNPYSALEDESDEDVENIYNESDNLFQSSKTGESSYTFTFTAVAGVGVFQVVCTLRSSISYGVPVVTLIDFANTAMVDDQCVLLFPFQVNNNANVSWPDVKLITLYRTLDSSFELLGKSRS
ncbi:zinc knuckle CX2CX4HX4C containing protein, partial [Tanacetum coccineum]